MTKAEEKGQLWWQKGVFYIVYCRSFKDSNGDGVGDLPGLIEKLDYMKYTLGIDAFWLAAVYPSPMKDFGYDISDYYDIHPLFGNMKDAERLLEEAHKRGLKVFMDFVPVYTSDQSQWFIESRSSRDNPKRDWYIWADPKADGSPPNNWTSIFGGSAWEFDEATGQYYYHNYLKEMPDVNWRNPELKKAMFDAMRFWLDKGADGFRADSVSHVMKDTQLRDNPLNPKPLDTDYKLMGDYDAQLHIYDRDLPEAVSVWQDFRKVLDSYGTEQPRAAFGEVHIFDWKKWGEYYGPDNDALHMPFNMGMTRLKWNVKDYRKVIDSIEASIPEGAWPNYMINNFDESRAASRYGKQQARVAAMMVLTLRGTPMLVYGEELGMPNVEIPPEKQKDCFGIRVPGLGRDPFRSPMQWSSEKNAGFSDAKEDKLWLPVSPDYKEINVESEINNPYSSLTLYRKLIAYRKASPALVRGKYIPLDQVPDDCYAYLREVEEECGCVKRVMVALNFSSDERLVNLKEFGIGNIAISTSLDRSGDTSLDSLKLRGNEGVIIELAR